MFEELLARFEADAPVLDAEELTTRLHEAIRAAPDAAALWRVLTTEPIEWASFTGDGELPREDLECVLARLHEWERPAVRGLGLGILGALATLDLPFAMTPDPAIQAAKRQTLALLDAHLAAWRSDCEGRSAALRGGAAMLLGRAPGAGPDDVALLARRVRAEKTASALGGAALALGLLLGRARRGELAVDAASGAEARAALRPRLAHASVPVRCAAAAALALGSGRVEAETAGPLKDGLSAARPLPREWGFFDGGFAPDTTRDLAASVFAACEVEPGLVEDALADLVRGARDAETLLRIGFGPFEEIQEERDGIVTLTVRFDRVPPGGLALEDVTPLQRHVLELFARIRPEWSLRWPLGFSNVEKEIPAFLQARAPAWRPIEVRDREGEVRHWHLPLLWRRVVLTDRVEPAEAIRAMTAAFAPPALLDLVYSRMDRFVRSKLSPGSEPRRRDRALFVALLDHLAVSGVDVRADLEARLARYQPLGPDALELLGVAVQHLLGPDDPARDGERAGKAVAQARSYYGE